MEIITNSAQETREFAKEFIENHLDSNVLALYGSLGSGKTTFVQGLAEALGVDEPITSPTFMIMRSYPLNENKFRRLVHIDLYRVSGWSDIEMLAMEEIWQSDQNLVTIEWPKRIEKHLPKQTQELRFEYLNEDQRQIIFEDSSRELSRKLRKR